MNIRKLTNLVFIMTVMIALLLTGCAGAGQPTVELTPRLKEIKDSGSLVIGTAITAPFEFRDPETGELKGLDVELANAIAAKIGVPIEWKEMAFGDLITALQEGKVDMVIAGMYITDARKELVDMSDGYLDTGLVIVTQAAETSITNAEEMSGKIVCVKTGSTGAKFVQTLNDGGATIKPQEYADTVSSLEDLSNGFCDGVLNDKINSLEYIKTHADLKVASEVLQPAQIGASVQKGDTELLALINSTIQDVKAGGDMDKLFNTWVLGQ